MGKDKMLPVALAALAGVVAATNPNPGETVVIGDHVGVYAGLTCTYFEGGPTLGDVVASAVALGLATGSCQDVTHYRNTRDAVCLTSGDASGFSCGTSSSGSFLACPTAPCEDPCDNLRVIRCLGADCSQASNDAGTFGIHELFLFDTDGVANNDCGGSAGSIGDRVLSTLPATCSLAVTPRTPSICCTNLPTATRSFRSPPVVLLVTNTDTLPRRPGSLARAVAVSRSKPVPIRPRCLGTHA